MRYIYICGVLPEVVNNRMQASVAGNKFSLNIIKALDRCADGKVDVITTSILNDEDKTLPLFDGKTFYAAPRKGGFMVCEFYQAASIFRQLCKLRRSHAKEKITILVENAPFAAMTAVSLYKRLFRVSAFAIVIDTPFAASLNLKTLAGKLNKKIFLSGQKRLKKFNGIISFTPDVEKDLAVDLPFHQLMIGHNELSVPPDGGTSHKDKHTVVYAGTLIYYNGIKEVLDAFKSLDAEYILHIYGYGPLEELVKQEADRHANIIYHGRFDPEDTRRILQQYDASINPRLIEARIENYTFPSKLVDYILARRPVLSSKFKTMPEAYEKIVYLFDEVKPESIADSIVRLFHDDPEEREKRIDEGIRFVLHHQSYAAIAEGIVKFINENVK